MSPPVLVLDNGASTLKVGLAHLDSTPRLLPNKVARLQRGARTLYVADELEKCNAWEDLHWRVPFERGILTNWDIEKVVWDRVFGSGVMKIDPKETSLLVTEPPMNLPNVGASYDQIVFEEYEFASYTRCTPASLVPYGTLYGDLMPEVAIVVDSGHSFTHVVPLLKGQVVTAGIRRIDIGGHLLTNHLKLTLSFRQFEMTDLTWVVEDIKHKLCFVSRSFASDIELWHTSPSPLDLSYVLPDLATEMLGHPLPAGRARSPTRPDQPSVHLNNERFAVPELIFRPSNIGLKQSGLTEIIAHAITALPEDIRGMAWANIGLIGGNVLFPGFRERLEDDLRPLAPDTVAVGVHQAKDPITSTYTSARQFALSPEYASHIVTKADYEEIGSSGIRRIFSGEPRAKVVPAPAPGPGGRRRTITVPEEDEEVEQVVEFEVSGRGRVGRGVKGKGRVVVGGAGEKGKGKASVRGGRRKSDA